MVQSLQGLGYEVKTREDIAKSKIIKVIGKEKLGKMAYLGKPYIQCTVTRVTVNLVTVFLITS